MIKVPCITHALRSTSSTKLWRNSELVCFAGRQTVVDSQCGEGNEYQVDYINQ
jgi:hypothetical protein